MGVVDLACNLGAIGDQAGKSMWISHLIFATQRNCGGWPLLYKALTRIPLYVSVARVLPSQPRPHAEKRPVLSPVGPGVFFSA